jgi:hypothetical protein
MAKYIISSQYVHKLEVKLVFFNRNFDIQSFYSLYSEKKDIKHHA